MRGSQRHVSILRNVHVLLGWEYYHFSNIMQYSNTALETTALVMYDPNTFFHMVPFFLMTLQIS